MRRELLNTLEFWLDGHVRIRGREGADDNPRQDLLGQETKVCELEWFTSKGRLRPAAK
jgi:hypothetical protein